MYEIYKTVKTKDEYFNTWDDKKNLALLTDELKKTIYDRYIIKCFVFQRDGFKCKNEGCKHAAALTMHHIKFQKNNGKDSVKNCITLCKTCHHGFHRGKNDLTFDGATYRVSKPDSVNWKIVKKKNKELRKSLKAELALNPIHISAALFEQLIRFLMINFEDMEDSDEDD